MMVMEKESLLCPKPAAPSLSRSPNLRSPWIDAVAAAAVERAGGNFCGEEASGIRVKIVISKEELRQLMEALSSSTPAAVQELLQGAPFRRRCMKVQSECSGKERRWRPELRSIPEEHY